MRNRTGLVLVLPARRVPGPLVLLIGVFALMAAVLAVHVVDADPRGPAAAPIAVAAPAAGPAPAAGNGGTDAAGLPGFAYSDAHTAGCSGPYGEQHVGTACVFMAVGALIILLVLPKKIPVSGRHALRGPPTGPFRVSARPLLPSLIALSVSRT